MVLGALLGFYIYLGYSRGSRRSPHEQGEHLAPHGPRRDLMNARTNYLWYSFLSDHNTCEANQAPEL